jgi:hypothetical protein
MLFDALPKTELDLLCFKDGYAGTTFLLPAGSAG